jgi:hypothetical protein
MLVLCTRDPEVPVTVTVTVPVAAVAEAVNVRVDEPGAVTDVGENEVLTPLGAPLALRLTEPPKPFRLPMLIVLVPFPPWVIVTDAGEAEIEKSGVAAGVTVSEMLLDRVVAPLVPVAWMVVVPVGVVPDTEIVSVLLTEPLAGGVTGSGL